MPAEAQPLRPLPQAPYIDAEKPLITITDAWLSSETPITRTAELADLVTSALFRRTIPLPRRKQPESPWLLCGVNLLVYPAEVIAITGDRRDGRSALLRLIAGVSPPTRGSVQSAGRVSPILNIADNSIADQLDAFDVLLFDAPDSMKAFSSEAIELLYSCRDKRRAVLIAAPHPDATSNPCTRHLVFDDGALIRDMKLQTVLRATA